MDYKLKHDKVRRSLYGGLASVKLNGKCGFIDVNGAEIIPLIYNEVEHFHNRF